MLLLLALPLYAAPAPYESGYQIYLITRPADLSDRGEPYEVELEVGQTLADPLAEVPDNKMAERNAPNRQESMGFEFSGDLMEQDDEPINSGAGDQTALTGKSNPPEQYFVEYDPKVIAVKDLPKLEGGAFNIICQNQKAWFKVDIDKAREYGIPQDKILKVYDVEDLLDMTRIDAYSREVCVTSTNVLRHASILYGHANLKVKSDGFLLNSWLKSINPSELWHRPQNPPFMRMPILSKKATEDEKELYKEQLGYYEQYEKKLESHKYWQQWYEDYRARRPKTPLMQTFWPDWFEHILAEEHPLFMETGKWAGKYSLTVKRKGVETINLNAQINLPGIRQDIIRTSFSESRPVEDRGSRQMQPALVLPFHVLSGEVTGIENSYTYTPLAQPRFEPENRPLNLHVYRTGYRPEQDQGYEVQWEDIPVIPAVVYDFYSDDDSGANPLNRQPRITYWVGEGGYFDGQLLGRRILYKDSRSKPIGCDAAKPVCHYEYPVYRGIEYRLVANIAKNTQQVQEKTDIRQPKGAPVRGKTPGRSAGPHQMGSDGGAHKKGISSWHTDNTGAKQSPGVVQFIRDEMDALPRSYLMSSVQDFLVSAAFNSIGVKYHSPIPVIPKILLMRLLHHMNLVN